MTALNKMLAETFAVDPSALVDSLKMKDVANWNSLTHIELIVGLESMFGLEFSQDDIVDMTSIGEIRRVLKKHHIALD